MQVIKPRVDQMVYGHELCCPTSPHFVALLKFQIEPTIIIAPSRLVSYWTLDSPSGVLSQKAIRSWLAYPEVPMYVKQSPVSSPVMAKTVLHMLQI
jgi:hypothetical protein